MYSFVQKATRDEVYQLEKEFNEKHPVGAIKPHKVDIEAMDKIN